MTAFVQRQLKTTSSDNLSRLRRVSAHRSRSALAYPVRAVPGSRRDRPFVQVRDARPVMGRASGRPRPTPGLGSGAGCPLVPVLALRLVFGHPPPLHSGPSLGLSVQRRPARELLPLPIPVPGRCRAKVLQIPLSSLYSAFVCLSAAPARLLCPAPIRERLELTTRHLRHELKAQVPSANSASLPVLCSVLVCLPPPPAVFIVRL